VVALLGDKVEVEIASSSFMSGTFAVLFSSGDALDYL
jgi:hypothetical protein